MKYGWDNIRHEILVDGIPKEKAQELEKKLTQTKSRSFLGLNVK